MSSPIAFLRRLLDAGMPLDMAMTAAEAFEQEAEAKAEVRRAKDRQRKRRTSSVSVESAELSENVEATETVESATPSLDKEIPPTPPKEIKPSPLTPTNTRDIRADREQLRQAREAAGDALADMAVCPGVASLARLKALLRGDAPCDWEADILPAITSAAAWHRKRDGKGSMTSWETAAKIAVQNRDSRLAGAPAKVGKFQAPPDRDDDFWRAAVRRWLADRTQWKPTMGPPPDDPNTEVPTHVLTEFSIPVRSAA